MSKKQKIREARQRCGPCIPKNQAQAKLNKAIRRNPGTTSDSFGLNGTSIFRLSPRYPTVGDYQGEAMFEGIGSD